MCQTCVCLFHWMNLVNAIWLPFDDLYFLAESRGFVEMREWNQATKRFRVLIYSEFAQRYCGYNGMAKLKGMRKGCGESGLLISFDKGQLSS